MKLLKPEIPGSFELLRPGHVNEEVVGMVVKTSIKKPFFNLRH